MESRTMTDDKRSRLETIRRTAWLCRRERPRPNLGVALDRINDRLREGHYAPLTEAERGTVALFASSRSSKAGDGRGDLFEKFGKA